jgi:hypothetical protein
MLAIRMSKAGSSDLDNLLTLIAIGSGCVRIGCQHLWGQYGVQHGMPGRRSFRALVAPSRAAAGAQIAHERV